ncbi:hypothetical protein KTO58_14035 [Chitinophaga pendula]|uniref:hypothetical protein n=1 Tax=Chitinophaga TaxID=79328 RepID=UPI0012FE6B76|nr:MULTISPECIES: hypothetical protein [Chitinophaga]UCJ04824.1 hypothetical protein KTO58_14035 [Chitinophaga pendula]
MKKENQFDLISRSGLIEIKGGGANAAPALYCESDKDCPPDQICWVARNRCVYIIPE